MSYVFYFRSQAPELTHPGLLECTLIGSLTGIAPARRSGRAGSYACMTPGCGGGHHDSK